MESNVQSMHKALEDVLDKIDVWRRDGVMEHWMYSQLFDIADAALSSPLRNCDRFADELDAQLAFLNEVWLISVGRETMLERDRYENWSDEMKTVYGRWLLSPTEEQKGE